MPVVTRNGLAIWMTLALGPVTFAATRAEAIECRPVKADAQTILPKIHYPPPSRHLQRESRIAPNGSALVRMLVAENGRLIEAGLVQSSGHHLVDEAALDTVTGATFDPGTVKGVPTQMCFEFRYTVEVTDPPKPSN